MTVILAGLPTGPVCRYGVAVDWFETEAGPADFKHPHSDSTVLDSFTRFIGIQSAVIYSEKFVSALGGVVAICATFYLSTLWIGTSGGLAILPSMGAATVLLFAVPHGQLSTPWALFGGNTLSAFAGVTAAMCVDTPVLAAGAAVGLAIFLMHLGRCLHPPGGATALAVILGGDAIQALGYWYVVTPTLANCCILFAVALLFNNRFHWRRYPQSLMRYEEVYNPDTKRILPSHIHEAIAQSDVVMDVSDEQIKRIVDLADQIMRRQSVEGFTLELGGFYTNGLPGRHWSVRQVVDERAHPDPARYMVIFRTVEGAGKGQADSCSLQEFADWAHEKMRPRNG